MLKQNKLLAISAFMTAWTFSTLPAAVLAQTGDNTSVDEIIVTAARTAKPLSTIPNTVTLIDQQALTRQISINPDLSTILGNMIPSFSPSRQKLTGYGESLRGRDPLYMVDGVPQSNPLRDGSRDGYTIDPLMLERVEVIHGANAIHGMGASGGIINMITRRPADEFRQSLRVESFAQEGDFSESLGYGLNYTVSGGRGNTDMLASIGQRSTGVGYDANDQIIGFDTAQGDTMDSDMVNVFLKGGYNWDDQRLELTVNHFDLAGNGDWTPVNGDRANGIPTTAVKGNIRGVPGTNEITMFSLAYTNQDFLGHNLRIQGFDQDFAGTFGGGTFGTFQDPAFGSTVFDQSQNNSGKQGMKLTMVRDQVNNLPLSLVWGMDYLSDQTNQSLVQTGRTWVPETDYRNYALFLQAEYTGIENVILTTGIRHEDSTLKVDDFTTLYSYNGGQSVTGGEPDFTKTLANIGATWQITDNWRLFGNYSEGFSMPDVGRVLRGIDQPGQDVETFLNLEPIVTENTELGIEYSSAALNVQLSYYTSDSDFGQRLQANADGIYTVNREKTEIDGFELRTEWLASDNDVLGLRYANTDGQYDSDDDDNVDTDLSGANMSPNRVNLSWDRSWSEGISTRIQMNHLFDRNFKDSAGITTSDFEGYTTFDASVELGFGGGTLRASAQNFTNEDYYTYYSQTLGNDSRNFKGLGRSFSVSYMMQF